MTEWDFNRLQVDLTMGDFHDGAILDYKYQNALTIFFC